MENDENACKISKFVILKFRVIISQTEKNFEYFEIKT